MSSERRFSAPIGLVLDLPLGRFVVPRLATAAGAILVVAVEIGATHADESVKSGRWQFTAVMPKPSTPFSLGVELDTKERALSQTECITPADLLPPMARLPAAQPDGSHVCAITKTDSSAGAVTWSMTCTLPPVTIDVDGIVQYHGVTAEGQYSVHGTAEGRPPIEKTLAISGIYLGPCDDD